MDDPVKKEYEAMHKANAASSLACVLMMKTQAANSSALTRRIVPGAALSFKIIKSLS